MSQKNSLYRNGDLCYYDSYALNHNILQNKELVVVLSTTEMYSGMYRGTFTEENVELHITTNEKRQPAFTINVCPFPIGVNRNGKNHSP